MRLPVMSLMLLILPLASSAPAFSQKDDWGINARFLVGMSLPMIANSGSSTDIPLSQQISNQFTPGASDGGGWDADDMTWAWLVDGTLHREIDDGWNIGAALGLDRRGRVTRREFEGVFYTRLHAYYLKLGPQISKISRSGNVVYLGMNAGLPLSVRVSNDETSTAFDTDSTIWNPLLEVQGGFRILPFDLFDGQVLFNIDLGVALTPMYSYENGRAYNHMFALRAGFSYYWEL